MSSEASRAKDVRSGVQLEVFTVIWMVVEAVVSLGAGILAGSALLTALKRKRVIFHGCKKYTTKRHLTHFLN